jgi:heat shock protein HtpX
MQDVPVVAVAGRGPSMALRAILALALMVGFYALAIAIAGGMLWLCYVIVFYGNHIPIKIILILLFSAGLIIKSILPRIDKFVPPGPQLMPEKHPRLFAELQAVSRATGQTMPAEVYLQGDVNAWVAQRGGVMGIGGRRVMGVGLALMRVLTLTEFRAVLAHEFGHYHGGDTRLGPWVHKTRSAIGRTIMSLGGNLLQKPFLWYGNMFLRITHAVSRRQEFTADRLAATIVGKEALANGLRKVHGAAVAFNPFWHTEMIPVLSAGFKPPLADGFARFMQSTQVASAMDKAIDKELKEEKNNPYDTHPPLRQRIAAVQDLPTRLPAGQDPPAISLLEDLPGLERSLLAAMASPQAVAKLADARWEDVAATVYVPMWRKAVTENRTLLQGLTPDNLPEKFIPALRPAGAMTEALQKRMFTISAALTIAALDAGATLECDLGTSVIVTRDGTSVDTFNAPSQLAKGELTAAKWQEHCAALGITGTDLAAVATSA